MEYTPQTRGDRSTDRYPTAFLLMKYCYLVWACFGQAYQNGSLACLRPQSISPHCTVPYVTMRNQHAQHSPVKPFKLLTAESCANTLRQVENLKSVTLKPQENY